MILPFPITMEVISRRQNEYYINNERVRLKDITELLTDSGTAKESFNIISQGKIDEILSNKPEDRRIIFEEAAGVLKYKRRKEEAIRKLDKTNQNLNRVNDIINELNSNKNPGVFCNSETIFCFFSYIISKFFVVVKQVLILIAVAGEDIGDQRLRVGHQKTVFIRDPFHTGKPRFEHLCAVFATEFLI